MKSRRAILKEEFARCAGDYFRAITSSGFSVQHVTDTREAFARAALELHLFEVGYRAALRKRKDGAA